MVLADLPGYDMIGVKYVHRINVDEYVVERKLSFISEYEEQQNISDSVRSITDIAQEVGYPYEILISAARSRHDRVLDDLACDGNVNVIFHDRKMRSEGLNLCLKASTGSHIIVFDAGKIYDLRYADIIHGYIALNENKPVMSELVAFPKSVAIQSGGWRNLVSGEDIDLMSRLQVNYGIIAFPLESLHSMDIEKFIDNGEYALKERILRTRDALIAMNFKFNDIKMVLKIVGRDHSTAALIVYLSKIFGFVSKVKPYDRHRNNYVSLMESLVESILVSEYEQIGGLNIKPSFSVSAGTREYLSKKSDVWNARSTDLSEIIE